MTVPSHQREYGPHYYCADCLSEFKKGRCEKTWCERNEGEFNDTCWPGLDKRSNFSPTALHPLIYATQAKAADLPVRDIPVNLHPFP
jgi:hypothetical protein